MKNTIKLILGGLFLLGQASNSLAAAITNTTAFTVQATVPAATGVSVTINKIVGTTWTLQTSTTLDYGTLTFDTKNKIYAPNYSYAADFAAAAGGSGTPSLTFSYSEGTNPNGSSNGFGTKSQAIFAKEVYSASGSIETKVGTPSTLGSISSVSLPTADFTGGWARVYLGVCTGASTDATGCSPFTAADKAGQYSGTLTVTTTLS